MLPGMRPIPANHHIWAALALLAMAVGNTVFTFYQDDVSDEQANLLAEALKRQDAGLFAHDPVFGPAEAGAPWRTADPAWSATFGALTRLPLSDPFDPFRILGGAMLACYLLGMYALAYRQGRSTSVAILVAFLSTAVFWHRRAGWGIGPIFTFTPTALYMSLTPLLALGFMHLRQRGWVVAVFFAAGALGNFHLASAVNLVVVLAVVVLGLGRLSRRSAAVAAAGVTAGIVGAAPAIYLAWAEASAAGAGMAALSMDQVYNALAVAPVNVLYPGVLIEALRMLPVAAFLALPSAVILFRGGRYGARDLGAWLWLLGAAALVALAVHGLAQVAAWWVWRSAPPMVSFFDAINLALLPLYVLLGQALVHYYRLSQAHRVMAMTCLAVLATAYFAASYNMMPTRNLVRACLAKLDKPAKLTDRQMRAASDRALRELGQWAGAHTEPDAVFITPEAEFRVWARRGLLCSPADLGYIYRRAPGVLPSWSACVTAQANALGPKSGRCDVADVVAFAEAHWADVGRAPLYVVISTDFAPAPGGKLAEVAPPAGTPAWDRNYWRLFRLLAKAPTTASAPAVISTP
jgi:hypothetical protein